MNQPVLSELDQHRIVSAVNDHLDQRRSKLIAVIGILIAVYGIASGLVLWAVQSSGKLAGESAATAAVDKKIAPQVEKINKLSDDTVANHANTKQFFEQTKEIHSEALKLEAQIKATLEQLEKANQVLAGNYNKIATQLASDDSFRKSVATASNEELATLRDSIKSITAIVPEMRNQLQSMASTTKHLRTDGKVTIVKGSLHVEDDNSASRLVLWNFGHSGIKSEDKSGKANALEIFNSVSKNE